MADGALERCSDLCTRRKVAAAAYLHLDRRRRSQARVAAARVAEWRLLLARRHHEHLHVALQKGRAELRAEQRRQRSRVSFIAGHRAHFL